MTERITSIVIPPGRGVEILISINVSPAQGEGNGVVIEDVNTGPGPSGTSGPPTPRNPVGEGEVPSTEEGSPTGSTGFEMGPPQERSSVELGDLEPAPKVRKEPELRDVAPMDVAVQPSTSTGLPRREDIPPHLRAVIAPWHVEKGVNTDPLPRLPTLTLPRLSMVGRGRGRGRLNDLSPPIPTFTLRPGTSVTLGLDQMRPFTNSMPRRGRPRTPSSDEEYDAVLRCVIKNSRIFKMIEKSEQSVIYKGETMNAELFLRLLCRECDIRIEAIISDLSKIVTHHFEQLPLSVRYTDLLWFHYLLSYLVRIIRLSGIRLLSKPR